MKGISALLLILVNSVVMAGQVGIEGGKFTPLYGSAKKPVKVDTFAMDVAPITNAEFLEFVTAHPEWRKNSVSPLFAEAEYLRHWQSPTELGPAALPDGPVVNVSWFAAKSFCAAKGMRLPTVNEWEYVASRPIPGADVRKVILEWYSVLTPDGHVRIQKCQRRAQHARPDLGMDAGLQFGHGHGRIKGRRITRQIIVLRRRCGQCRRHIRLRSVSAFWFPQQPESKVHGE